jgi:enoyl-[acyl-carrier protein] reductase III
METSSTGLRIDLGGRVALVTGSSRGLGRATAVRLASLGAVPIITYRKQQAEAEAVAVEIRGNGGECFIHPLDMGDTGSIDELFAWLVGPEGPGGLDILVANAAASAFKPLIAVKPHHVEKTFAITITGFLAAVQSAVPLMQARGGGRIVAVSGVDTRAYGPAHGLLAAAKAGMEVLVRYLQIELGGTGVTVVGVNPGAFRSEGPKLLFGPLYDRIMGALDWAHPGGALEGPIDVSEAVVLCCTDAAALLAGQTHDLDAGAIFGLAGKFTELAARTPPGATEVVTSPSDSSKG